VGKPTVIPVAFVFMKELTLERNPMDVSSVGNPLNTTITFRNIVEFTLGRNPMDVSNVECLH
jgi:hypothetical protein